MSKTASVILTRTPAVKLVEDLCAGEIVMVDDGIPLLHIGRGKVVAMSEDHEWHVWNDLGNRVVLRHLGRLEVKE